MGEPTMYCGASSHHIHCENFEFKSGEKLLYFGRDEIDKITTWLDVRNCSGTITPTTFTLFPALQYINFTGSTLEFTPKVFALLKNLRSVDMREGTLSISKELFEGGERLESLYLSDLKLPDTDCFTYLTNLDNLNIENCSFENCAGSIFNNLHKLTFFMIQKCQLNMLGKIYKDLENLESLTIMNNKIGEFDCASIEGLKNLNRLCIFNNETSSVLNYDFLKELTSLETILLDTSVYTNMDFQAFPNLKVIEIGTLTDEITEEENHLMEKLKSMNIRYTYVFCGEIEVDMSKVHICA